MKPSFSCVLEHLLMFSPRMYRKLPGGDPRAEGSRGWFQGDWGGVWSAGGELAQ